MQLKASLFTLLLAGVAFSGAYAQNKNVRKAESSLKSGDLKEARSYILPATQDEKTADKAETWYLKGEIYSALAKKDSGTAVGETYMDTAFSAYKQTLKLDPKYTSMLLSNYKPLSDLYVDYWRNGAGAFNNKDYAAALNNFKKVKQVNDYLHGLGLGLGSEIDTMAILNIGNAAYNLGKKDTAVKYYQQLADINYTGATEGGTKYKVTSSPGGFDVTYKNANGGTEQQKVTSGSWTKSFNGEAGEFYTISAQAANKNASITVEIINNGSVLNSATSKGDFVIASTNATLKENGSSGGSNNSFIYKVLLQEYKDANEDKFMEVLQKAKTLFPNDKDFANAEISYYNEKGATDKLVEKLEEEVAKNPDDYGNTLNLAIAYDNMANPKTDSGTTGELPANHDELFNKAIQYYRKAISLKPGGYAANFNLGLMYYNAAAHIGSSLGSSNVSQTKQDSLIKQQNVYLDSALPYLKAAYETLDAKPKLDPNELVAYKNAIIGLQGVYARKSMMDEYNALKKKLDSADSKAQ